jgi:hypothetical protein
MYHDRTAWRYAFLWAKNMDAAKDMHKEMLPIWAKKRCPYGQHFFVDILCCIHNFCPQKLTTLRCSIVVHVFRGATIL